MLQAIVAILIVLFVLVVALLTYASTKPITLQVKRSVVINTAAETIFPYINDFHHWSAWSPYEKKDPNMKKTYSGAQSGKGAIYEWDGNGNVGKGRIEITESLPYRKITLDLVFEKPMKGKNVVDFTLAPQDNSTEVTWDMHGPAAFMTKIVGIFLNMDKMIGNDFEAGLANLKALTE